MLFYKSMESEEESVNGWDIFFFTDLDLFGWRENKGEMRERVNGGWGRFYLFIFVPLAMFEMEAELVFLLSWRTLIGPVVSHCRNCSLLNLREKVWESSTNFQTPQVSRSHQTTSTSTIQPLSLSLGGLEEMEAATTGGGGGGNTLSEIYQNAKKIQLRTRDALERLERLEYSTGGSMESQSPDLSSSIKRDLNHIQSLCVEMDRLCRSLPSKSHRDLWKRYNSVINSFAYCLINFKIRVAAFYYNNWVQRA